MLSTKTFMLTQQPFPVSPPLTHWGLARRFKKIHEFESCMLTHRGHTCVSKLSIIGSDNVLLPGRRQANI